MIKKFLMALAATTLVASPMVTTQAQAATTQHREVTRSVQQDGHGHVTRTTKTVRTERQWRKGERFNHRYASNYRVIANPHAYHLQPAPRGYHWVRSGNDAVLVAVAGGLIGAVIANAIH